MQNNMNEYIDVGQLRVGLYVHLDLGWMDHPFGMSNFKLKDEDQISKIKKIGLKKLRYDPKRSDCEPLPIPRVNLNTGNVSDVNLQADPVLLTDNNVQNGSAANDPNGTASELQQQRLERLRQLNRALDESEKSFIAAGNTARTALKNMLTQPKQSITEAESLVNAMVDCALNQNEIAIQAINGSRSNDSNYVHSLNVTVLTLMMARSLSISEADSRELAMAALFHDIGKMEIPDKILLKKDTLTKSEQSYYEQHSELGARMAKQSGLSDRVARIILQHHECADSTGYPKHLKAEQTDPLARLVAMINGYDNLCNPGNGTAGRTPYEALAHMFANQRSKYDEVLLKHLIKSLGVYPPGSIVQLSNGLHGVVIAVNPGKPLRPYVMLHDALAQRHPPPILDLREEPSINITICMKPSQLPEDALNYLNPRKRISYFIDQDLQAPAA